MIFAFRHSELKKLVARKRKAEKIFLLASERRARNANFTN